MAEMLVQSESLTNIADEIRILSGTEGSMSLDSMKINVAEANTNVDTQAELIAQIQDAVDSLPEAGNAGDSGANGTFTLKIVVDTTYDDAIMTDQIGYIYYISHRQPINWEYDGAGQLTEIVLEDVDINTYIVIDFGITNVATPSYFVLETSQNLYPVIDGVLYYGTEVNTVETISIRVY